MAKVDSKIDAAKLDSISVDSINVVESKFLLSIERHSQAPAPLYTEIAILGRSNVGKSSIINAILNNKNLAKSSSTPGKTRLINFFLSTWRIGKKKNDERASNKIKDSKNIDLALESSLLDSSKALDSIFKERESEKKEDNKFDLRFIDFPGFGYAKVSKEQKNVWDRNLSEFLKKRDSIKLYIHLIDSRHLNLSIDNEIRNFLSKILRPDSEIIEVFTKADKLNKIALSNLKKLDTISVSIKDNQSIRNLRKMILNKLYGV